VVPLESQLVTTSNIDSLSSSLRAANIASHVLGGDILDGVVVRWATNVTTGLVTAALVDVVDRNAPNGAVCCDHLEGAGSCHSEKGGSLHCDCLESKYVLSKVRINE
jgi:hypothetical protein